ncbi:MAG: hypothetical protein WBX10_01060, partial [Candidatus Sulfotelmatobacter sp.]
MSKTQSIKSTVAAAAPQTQHPEKPGMGFFVSTYTCTMPRTMARGPDILARPAPKRPPRLTSRRIGIHTSTAGGIHNAAERAYRLGCNTLQVFSSSPRQWAPYELSYP